MDRQVFSSHGVMTINADGDVVLREFHCTNDIHGKYGIGTGCGPGCLDQYKWFDLDEWQRYYKAETLPDCFDVLDLAGNADKGWFPADETHRQIIAELREKQ